MMLEAKSNWGWCAFCLRLHRMMSDNWRFRSLRAFLQVNKRTHVNYWSKSCIIRYSRSIQDTVMKHWINPCFFVGCLCIYVVCLLHIVPMVALFLSCPRNMKSVLNLWIRDTYHVCNVIGYMNSQAAQMESDAGKHEGLISKNGRCETTIFMLWMLLNLFITFCVQHLQTINLVSPQQSLLKELFF